MNIEATDELLHASESRQSVTDATVEAAKPATLSKPTAERFSFPKAQTRGEQAKEAAPSPRLRLIRGRIAGASGAVAQRYQDASASTDAFVHESPWKSIAYAILAGVIVGMLAAR
jgi:ElaB/YqjD/DUF883 family membrane-anchored ribosome-binding protein